MDNQSENIPENADMLLFAEDLVSYVMTYFFYTLYEGTRATPYREFIHNAFNENVKAAAKHFFNRFYILDTNILRLAETIIDPSESEFLLSIANIPVVRASEGIPSELILFYCVVVASIAGIYRVRGLQEAPDMAVSRIFEFLRDCGMTSAGWDRLNSATLMFGIRSRGLSFLSSSNMENIGVGHRHLRNSSSDAMELSLPDNTNHAAAEAEKTDEDKIPAADSSDTFAVHEIMDAENLHSTCFSTTNEHLQPSEVLQEAMGNTVKYDKERQDKIEMHDVDLKGTLNNNQNIEAQNRRLPSLCENLEDLKISQVETASNRIRNVEISVVETEDTSYVDGQTDSCYPPKCLDELEESDNAQIFDSREECEKGNVAEDSSLLVPSEGESETSGSCQLRGSVSESEVRDEKPRKV